MKKTKRYEEGGFTFADENDFDREAAIKQAMADIENRGKQQAEDLATERAGETAAEEKPVRRAEKKVAKAVAKDAVKEVSKEVEAPRPTRAERAPSSVKVNPITGPAPAPSRAAAMPDVSARRAATAERTGRRSVFGGENRGVPGMKAGGKVSSASKRADGCAVRGKTKGRMV